MRHPVTPAQFPVQMLAGTQQLQAVLLTQPVTVLSRNASGRLPA